MADVLNPNPVSPPCPPPPNSEQKSNMPMLFYGLAVVGTAALALALYNLIIIKRCGRRHIQTPPSSSSSLQANRIRAVEAVRAPDRSSFDQAGLTNFRNMVWSFKYKMREGEGKGGGGGRGRECDCECVVCLSGFEEGEEVRKLPRCNHCFHAECIDKWLCSHFDCPICRTPVVHFSLPSPAENYTINGVGV